jgi:arsenate reductase (thioredoxin)
MSKRDGCKRVLFVCTGNACRSPMAEAIARLDAPDVIDAFSAGLMPAGFVPELTKQTLMKNGYCVEGLESKGISSAVWERVDVVINMSGRPKKEAFREHSKVVDWEIEDPFERGPEDYQRVFDKIRARVGALAEEYRREYAAKGMLGTQDSAQNATALAERRAKTRTPVKPLVYVDIENVNGGFVCNMTEDGIAMSAAMVLRGDSPLKMRIQLPGAGGWIEAIGQIKWKSGSGKTVGIRLVGLPEETRKVIRNWLALERSKPAPEPELYAFHRSASDAKATAPVVSVPIPLTPLTFVKTSKPAPGPHEETKILTNRSAGPVTESFPESIPLNTDEPAIRGASAQFCERRVHPRRPIMPLSHVEVGPNNAGMLLNISDSGLALIVAMRLAKDDLPTIRIHFADSKDSLEVSGQIVWLSESKREAGIQFVNLTDEARKRIALRISEHPVARAASSWPALKGGGLEKKPSPIEASHAASQKSPRKIEPGFAQKPVFDPLTSGARTKRYVGLSAVLTSAAVIALAIAGIASLPTVRTEIGGYVARSAPNMDKPNAEKAPLSPTKAPDIPLQKTEERNSRQHELELPPTESRVHRSKTRGAIALPVMHGIQRTASSPRVTTAAPQAENSLSENLTTKVPESIASTEPKQSVESSASQVSANSLPPLKEGASAATLVKQPVTAAQMTGEVSVLTDPYPSLRADERGSKKQKHGASLELGHLLSRVVPVYPQEAKRQGIQGTVKLHAVVDRYGSVKSMQPVSGPAILGAAVVNAVRQWQYTETKLAGQPVETEVDVAVVFRLSNSATPKS